MKKSELDVQLAGYTVFLPPMNRDGRYIMTPDVTNFEYAGLYSGEALAEFGGRSCYLSWDKKNPNTRSNEDYLRNILSQKHYSVLEHASVSLYLQGVSRALSHELVRHRHFSYSQLSQRYVDSSGVEMVVPPALRDDAFALEILEAQTSGAAEAYAALEKHLVAKGLKKKQAREAARAVLPNATETKILVTGNYRSWIEFLLKRDSPAADAEIREAANRIGNLLANHSPNVFGPEARALWDLEAVQQREARV